MIKKRAELDTVNPPGQIVNPIEPSGGVRYLRDVIKKYQEEDRPTAIDAVAEAFKRGYEQGYQQACKDTGGQCDYSFAPR